jgi:hypothetical protein
MSRKEKVMRALLRRSLVPLILAAATFSAVAPAQFAAAATVHSTVKIAPRACPAGTNWDNITHTCV